MLLFDVGSCKKFRAPKTFKAQVSVISIVLITGILIALSGTAYMWGVPIIEKNTAVTEFQTAENFILNLNEKIIDIANTGAGEESSKIPAGLVTVVPNNTVVDNNSIILEFISKQPMIWDESEIYLGETSLRDVLTETGTYGEASPGIITMRGDKSSAGTKIKIKLHYRDLVAKNKKYKIVLNDQETAQTGNTGITISFDKTETKREADYEMIITHIKVNTA